MKKEKPPKEVLILGNTLLYLGIIGYFYYSYTSKRMIEAGTFEMIFMAAMGWFITQSKPWARTATIIVFSIYALGDLLGVLLSFDTTFHLRVPVVTFLTVSIWFIFRVTVIVLLFKKSIRQHFIASIRWKWKPKRWWICLTLFLLVGTPTLFLIGLLAPDPVNPTALTRAAMIGFLIVGVGTDRAWPVGIRVIWMIGCYILHLVLMIPSVFISRPYYNATHNVQVFDFLMVVTAALPIIFWTMRRSTYFIEPNDKRNETSPSEKLRQSPVAISLYPSISDDKTQ